MMTRDQLYPIIDEVLHERKYEYSNPGSAWLDRDYDDVDLRIHELAEALCDALCKAIEELTAERDASRLIISDLTAEVERLRDEMSTMHRTVVHDCCVQVQSERALADQLASHLEWALRCVGSLPTEMRMTFDNRMAEVLAAHKEARRG